MVNCSLKTPPPQIDGGAGGRLVVLFSKKTKLLQRAPFPFADRPDEDRWRGPVHVLDLVGEPPEEHHRRPEEVQSPVLVDPVHQVVPRDGRLRAAAVDPDQAAGTDRGGTPRTRTAVPAAPATG